jgi:hypothetical protein
MSGCYSYLVLEYYILLGTRKALSCTENKGLANANIQTLPCICTSTTHLFIVETIGKLDLLYPHVTRREAVHKQR